MPLGGLLAYLNELGPVSAGPSAENEVPYQGAAGEMSLDAEPVLEDEEQLLAGAPPELGEDIAMEGEEGFPMAPGMEDAGGLDPQMLAALEGLLGGARG